MKHFKSNELILFEDEVLMIVNKPVGIPVIGGHTIKLDLKSLMEKYFNQELFLCHRLDQFTSGCLVFCKTSEAFKTVYAAFSEHRVNKTYEALLEGILPKEGLSIRKKIKDSGNKAYISPAGRDAETNFSPIAYFGNRYTLSRIFPKTGRRHQIRVHAQFAGHPLAGDSLYGGKAVFLSDTNPRFKLKKGDNERPLNGESYLLHASAIEFNHPLTEAPIRFVAPLPKQFSVCLKQLGKMLHTVYFEESK